MRLHQIGQRIREANLFFDGCEGCVMEGLEGGERVLVIVVDTRYTRVGSYYKGEVLESSNTVGKADGDEGRGERC